MTPQQRTPLLKVLVPMVSIIEGFHCMWSVLPYPNFCGQSYNSTDEFHVHRNYINASANVVTVLPVHTKFYKSNLKFPGMQNL